MLTGDVHTSFANDLSEDPFDPLLPSAAVEFVTPSISNSNFDEGLGVPPRTTSLAVEQSIKVQNPNTRYVELDSNGWVLLDVTAERVQAEFLFVDTVREPSEAQRLDAAWQVLRATQRLSPGGPATAPRSDRPAPPPEAASSPPPAQPAPVTAAPAGPQLPATGGGQLAAAALVALAGAAAARGALRSR